MHKLHRDPQAPSGLNYRHGVHTWGNGIPTRQEKAEIWVKLIAMQGERCAYCEGPMPESSRHIEHFQQRSRSPQNTFLWNNLFGSCNRRDTCGNHKDQCGNYPHADLIKPDEEDPEHFLVFGKADRKSGAPAAPAFTEARVRTSCPQRIFCGHGRSAGKPAIDPNKIIPRR